MKLLSDTGLLFGRYLGLTLRNPVWLVVNVSQPLFFLVLFGPLLRPLAGTPGFPAGEPFNVFVPGLLVQLALFGTAFAGFSLIGEVRHGVIERMRVTPVSRMALLLGRALRDTLVLIVQALILVLCAVPFGLRVSPLGVAVVVGLLCPMGVLFASLSYALALRLRSEDALAATLNTVTMPLLLLSGILLPLSLAPAWLRALAAANPLSYAVAAARALFNEQLGDPSIPRAVAILGLLAAAALLMAAREFRRAAA
ncbi:MAG TPA: ABC transporter permease [Chloroflexota bacterium]|jgi:ABC-2 type transport system permease protein|nr:ABC transporter permease [Chloroflexota bacterium]